MKKVLLIVAAALIAAGLTLWVKGNTTSTGTRLIHKELFSGMFVPLFWSSVEKNVPAMLNSMNEALKTKAEKPLH